MNRIAKPVPLELGAWIRQFDSGSVLLRTARSNPVLTDDPEAAKRFQAVGEAYQVLSNDELRAKYDASGKAALDASSLVDPMQFFSMLFGSEPFEYLIGELRLATMFAAGGDGMGNEAYMTYKQKRREVICALTLKGLLAQFCCGDEAEFEAEMHSHAKRLHEAPVGEALVWTCGYIYESKGLQAMGGIEAIGAGAKQTMHTAAAQMRVAGAAINTYRAYRKDIKESQKREEKKEEKAGEKAKEKVKEKADEKIKDKEMTDGQSSRPNGGGGGGDGGGGGGSGESYAENYAENHRAGSSTRDPPSLVGKRVLVEGLVGRADLNGCEGIAGVFDEEAGRYTVRLDDGECIKIRTANLQVAAEEGTGGGGGAASGGGGAASAGALDGDSSCDGTVGCGGGFGGRASLIATPLARCWREAICVSRVELEASLVRSRRWVWARSSSTDRIALSVGPTDSFEFASSSAVCCPRISAWRSCVCSETMTACSSLMRVS